MRIDTKKFQDLFEKCQDLTGISPAEIAISGLVREEEKEKVMDAFQNTLRIMRAKKASDVDDLSIEQIISCLKYERVYNQLFVDAVTNNVMYDVESKWPKLVSRLPRRVL